MARRTLVVVMLTALAAAAPASAQWGETTTVTSQNGACCPVAAIDATGTGALAWLIDAGTQRTSHGAVQLTRLQVAVRDADGRFATAQTLTPPNVTAIEPDVAVTPAGEVIVVWVQAVRARRAGVYFAVAKGGGTFSKPKRIELTGGTLLGAGPRLAVDGAGNATLAWSGALRAGKRNERRAMRWSRRRAGGRFARPKGIGKDAGVEVRVAVDGQGNAFVAYSRIASAGAPGTPVIRAAVMGAADKRFSAPRTISGRPATRPGLAVSGTGEAIITFRRTRFDDASGTKYGAVQAVTRKPKSRFGAAETLTGSTQQANDATIVAGREGDALALLSQRLEREPFTETVAAAVRRPNEGFGDPDGTAASAFGPMAIDAAGTVLLAYTDPVDNTVKALHRRIGESFHDARALADPDSGAFAPTVAAAGPFGIAAFVNPRTGIQAAPWRAP